MSSTRRRGSSDPPISTREVEQLRTAIDKLTGAVEDLKQQLVEQDKILLSHSYDAAAVKARVDHFEPRISALEDREAERAAIAKAGERWRAALYGGFTLLGGIVAAIVGYLK